MLNSGWFLIFNVEWSDIFPCVQVEIFGGKCRPGWRQTATTSDDSFAANKSEPMNCSIFYSRYYPVNHRHPCVKNNSWNRFLGFHLWDSMCLVSLLGNFASYPQTAQVVCVDLQVLASSTAAYSVLQMLHVKCFTLTCRSRLNLLAHG